MQTRHSPDALGALRWCAVHTTVPKGRSFTTTQLGINYVKAVPIP